MVVKYEKIYRLFGADNKKKHVESSIAIVCIIKRNMTIKSWRKGRERKMYLFLYKMWKISIKTSALKYKLFYSLSHTFTFGDTRVSERERKKEETEKKDSYEKEIFIIKRNTKKNFSSSSFFLLYIFFVLLLLLSFIFLQKVCMLYKKKKRNETLMYTLKECQHGSFPWFSLLLLPSNNKSKGRWYQILSNL